MDSTRFQLVSTGWHRRFFFLENGILSYAKNSGEMARGRSQGQIDLAIAFISYKSKEQRIDIDADEFIYHLKVRRYRLHYVLYLQMPTYYECFCLFQLKDQGSFDKWIDSISAHRRFKQQELAKYDNASPRSSTAGPTDQRVLAWVLNTPAPTSVCDRLLALSKQLTTLEDSVHSFTVRPPPRKKPPRRQRREDEANGGAPVEETKEPCSLGQEASSMSSLPQTTAALSPMQEHSPPHQKEDSDRASEASAPSGLDVCCPSVTPAEVGQAAQEFLDNARHFLTEMSALANQLDSQQRRASLRRGAGHSPELDVLRSTLNAFERENAQLKHRLAKVRAIVDEQPSGEASEVAEAVELPTAIVLQASSTPAVPPPGASALARRLVHENSHETSSLLSTTEFYDAAEQLSVCASSSEGSFCSEGDTDGEGEFFNLFSLSLYYRVNPLFLLKFRTKAQNTTGP